MPETEGARRLHPRLRVVRNGDRFVNAARSDGSTTVACGLSASREAGGVPPSPALAAASPSDLEALRKDAEAPRKKLPKRGKIEAQPQADEAYVNVLIELHAERPGMPAADRADSVEKLAGTLERAVPSGDRGRVGSAVVQRRNFVAATVPVSLLDTLAADPAVAFVHPADPLKLDAPPPRPAQAGSSRRSASAATLRTRQGRPDRHHRCRRVRFRASRFSRRRRADALRGDLGSGAGRRPPPVARGFDYGSEFTKAAHGRRDRRGQEARRAARHAARASVADRRPGSHGTHVASIAAGNSGVCPEALIAGVLIDVPLPDDPIERRRTTFSDTSRIIHAVEYLLAPRRRDRECRSSSTSASAPTAARTTARAASRDGSTPTSRRLAGRSASPRATPVRRRRRPRATSAGSWGASTRRAACRRAGSRSSSSGRSSATASKIDPRTSSRSGTARRIASPSR